MAKPPRNARTRANAKSSDLARFVEDGTGETLTSNQGIRIQNNQDTLKAGERGPSLLEDFHFREKITHFDHERIPERVVHARGSAAHGHFQVYESLAKYTRAAPIAVFTSFFSSGGGSCAGMPSDWIQSSRHQPWVWYRCSSSSSSTSS